MIHVKGHILKLCKQQEIGREHFSKGRISINLTKSMSKYYKKEKITGIFTRIGWTKTILELMIIIHINE